MLGVISSAEQNFDLHTVENFFEADTCARLVEKIRRAEQTSALTYGSGDTAAIAERTRKVRQARLDQETISWVTAKLFDYMPHLREHFSLPLSTCEEPQFLWYGPGDFFVAHQDGNTGLLRLETDRLRRVSISIFLNRRSEMDESQMDEGGSLVFTDRLSGNRFVVNEDAGKMIAFRSELTHEVTPVVRGDRFAIVTWCRIMP